jgi:hypothetical protein
MHSRIEYPRFLAVFGEICLEFIDIDIQPAWLYFVQLLTFPSNVVVTLDFHHDQVAFAELAREHIVKHATKTRAEHRSAILSGA